MSGLGSLAVAAVGFGVMTHPRAEYLTFVFPELLLVVLAVGWGLPQLEQPPATALGNMGCVAQETPEGKLAPCTGDGPAQRAGLQRGDLVLRVNGAPVASPADVERLMRRAGRLIQIEALRGNRRLVLQFRI